MGIWVDGAQACRRTPGRRCGRHCRSRRSRRGSFMSTGSGRRASGSEEQEQQSDGSESFQREVLAQNHSRHLENRLTGTSRNSHSIVVPRVRQTGLGLIRARDRVVRLGRPTTSPAARSRGSSHVRVHPAIEHLVRDRRRPRSAAAGRDRWRKPRCRAGRSRGSATACGTPTNGSAGALDAAAPCRRP